MVNKHTKRCLTSYVSMELQIKQWDSTIYLLERFKFETPNTTLAGVAELLGIVWFGSQSGRAPGLQAPFPVSALAEGNQSASLSHISVSLPLSPPPPLSEIKIKYNLKNPMKYQMPVWVWRNRNSHVLLVRIQNGTVSLEDNLAISY